MSVFFACQPLLFVKALLSFFVCHLSFLLFVILAEDLQPVQVWKHLFKAFLSFGSKPVHSFLVMMDTVRWLVVTVVAEINHQAVFLGLFLIRSTKYMLMMAFQPTHRTAHETLLFFLHYRLCHQTTPFKILSLYSTASLKDLKHLTIPFFLIVSM